jgi:anti-sigma regulatory factor (Ser/Thr protein kinase)
MTSARRFHRLPESVPAARRFARDVLRGQPGELVDAAELMVSELATNCVQHARTDFEITIEAHDEVRVEVRDTDHHGRPEVQYPPPEAPSGRGLRIVSEIADAWGIIKSPSGKTVWFVLNLHPTEPGDRSHALASSGQMTDGLERLRRSEVRPEGNWLRRFRRTPKAMASGECIRVRRSRDRRLATTARRDR